MTSVQDLPFIDYSETAYQADPFLWLADKASQSKMARSERGIELLDYDLCRAFLLDRRFGTDHANLVEKMGLPESRALTYKRRMLLVQNRNETRKRIRNTLTNLIGPKQAADMQGEIAGVISNLLDGLGDTADLKYDFADLVPSGVYCSWVNAPLSDARFVAEHSEAVLAIFRRDPSLTAGIVKAYDELFDFAKVQLARRRANMGDDFLSRMIRAREAGEISEGELEDFAVMLIEASTDNTSHQISIAIDRLAQMPDVWRAISQDPSLAAPAVTEAMRMWPRSISTSRFALEAAEIDGVTIPYGSTVFASFGAVHRQPDQFDDPHTFRPDRPARPSHLNFGGGAFSCLGQFVANIEVQEAVAQMAQRFPNLRVEKSERDFTAMFQAYHVLEASLS